jgi:hypothetical protein
MAGLKKSDIVVFYGAKLRTLARGVFGKYQDFFTACFMLQSCGQSCRREIT